MAKKNFKKNNPALQFITEAQETEKEENALGESLEKKEARAEKAYSAPSNTPVAQVAYNTQEVRKGYEDGAAFEKAENAHQAPQIPHQAPTAPIAYNTQEVQKAYDAGTAFLQTENAEISEEKNHTSGTQGKKGQKLPRINMAFSNDNLSYLKLIARVEGCSMTEYVNRLIAKDEENRQEEVAAFKALFKK